MSNTTTKFAIALFLVLATSAASFARGGGGSAAMGHSGSTAVGTVGGRPNAAELGALGNMSTDPSGIGNASRVAPIPPPRITVPTVPQFK
jgi:hypothetical protein